MYAPVVPFCEGTRSNIDFAFSTKALLDSLERVPFSLGRFWVLLFPRIRTSGLAVEEGSTRTSTTLTVVLAKGAIPFPPLLLQSKINYSSKQFLHVIPLPLSRFTEQKILSRARACTPLQGEGWRSETHGRSG